MLSRADALVMNVFLVHSKHSLESLGSLSLPCTEYSSVWMLTLQRFSRTAEPAPRGTLSARWINVSDPQRHRYFSLTALFRSSFRIIRRVLKCTISKTYFQSILLTGILFTAWLGERVKLSEEGGAHHGESSHGGGKLRASRSDVLYE